MHDNYALLVGIIVVLLFAWWWACACYNHHGGDAHARDVLHWCAAGGVVLIWCARVNVELRGDREGLR